MKSRFDMPHLLMGVALIVAIVLLVVPLMLADHGVKKSGHDLYWKNWIALADDDAFVNDSLVKSFLQAEESLGIDSTNGELIIASERRGYSPDHQVGWLLQVIEKADVIRGDGKLKKIYVIKTHLVFDFRVAGEE